jgi:hypothetical protein
MADEIQTVNSLATPPDTSVVWPKVDPQDLPDLPDAIDSKFVQATPIERGPPPKAFPPGYEPPPIDIGLIHPPVSET